MFVKYDSPNFFQTKHCPQLLQIPQEDLAQHSIFSPGFDIFHASYIYIHTWFNILFLFNIIEMMGVDAELEIELIFSLLYCICSNFRLVYHQILACTLISFPAHDDIACV